MLPIFAWIGGKRSLLPYLREYFPERFTTYIEPFLGGGAVLLDILSARKNTYVKNVYAGDINKNLIGFYQDITFEPQELYTQIESIESDFTSLSTERKKAYYYKCRSEYNEIAKENLPQSIRRSALFYFLMHYCYRGLYRSSRHNEFDNSFDSRQKPINLSKLLIFASFLNECKQDLETFVFQAGNFNQFDSKIDSNSFIYLDPPYRRKPNENFFYQGDIIEEQQKIVRISVDELQKVVIKNVIEWAKRGAKIVLSNQDFNDGFYDDFITKSGFYVEKLSFPKRFYSQSREKQIELIFSNISKKQKV